MPDRRRSTALVLLLLALAAADGVRADEPAPAPPPASAPAARPSSTETLLALARLKRRVEQLFQQGLFAQASVAARELLERAEQTYGAESPLLAGPVALLARVLQAQGAYAAARPLFERALALQERMFGKDQPPVTLGMSLLAGLMQLQGDHEQARPLLERALAILEKAFGPDHPQVAGALNNLAALLQEQGEFAQARPLHDRALAIRERALGPDHEDVGLSLGNIAMLLEAQGAYGEARPLLERAIAIQEAALGRDHPLVAMSLDNLAGLLVSQGAYVEARPLYERALAIREQALGASHPDLATSLNNLATALQEQGGYAEARPLYERALAIQEQALGAEHPAVATTLANLGLLSMASSAPAEARERFERALAIQERALGKDHPGLTPSLNNLAALLQSQGALAEARPLHERALVIKERALGEGHPSVATSLNNLAMLLAAQGDPAAARRMHERALAIRTQALGEDHPDVASSLCNLAGLLRAEGAMAEARAHYERALALTEAHARRQFAGLSARQRLDLLRATRHRLDAWLEFAPEVGETGYAEVLRFRGLMARAEAAERTLSRRADAQDRRLLDALLASQHLAARLAHEMPPAGQAQRRASWQRRYAEATAERERLTLELAARSAPLRGALERLDLTLADVQARLEPDAALVDLLRVGARYLAWIVRSKGAVARVDLGSAAELERAARELLAEIRAADAGEDPAARALRALAWTPIEARMGEGVRTLVLVPDAALAAVPFGALPGRAPGTHLLDDVSLSYAMHAFDLVPRTPAPAPGAGALLVGGVDYEQAGGAATPRPRFEDAPALALADRAPQGTSFRPIPQTLVEVEALARRFGPGTPAPLTGPAATEARMREAAPGKRVVHVATHGFAREDLLAGLYDRKISEAWTHAGLERQLAAGHDPMLLSGLALAGANPRQGGGADDGILTALEASYLDLDGCELVTLSACETAKGTAESGEGVLGLVSAFQMAGARHVIASLWKVDDEATRLLMEGLYERLLRTENPLAPADALREAALALRDRVEPDGRRRFAAPRYWAAFVAYGG